MIGIFVVQGRHCLIYCQTRRARNEKYITLDGAPPKHLMELCDSVDLGIKVNATDSKSFIAVFSMLCMCQVGQTLTLLKKIEYKQAFSQSHI